MSSTFYSKRLGYIDDLKGFAIILVVIGHVIQFIISPDTYSNDIVFRYIYAFHMQFFIMLSGLTTKEDIEGMTDFYATIKKRAIQLLVPYFVWGLIAMIIGGGINSRSIIRLFIYPGDKLWFLWDLFFINASFVSAQLLAHKFRIKLIYALGIVFCMLVLFSKIASGIADTGRIYRLFLFYILGYYCKRLKMNQLWKIALPFVLIGFAVTIYFWRMTPSQSLIVNNDLLNSIFATTPYRLVVSLLGCITFLFLGQLFSKFLDRTVLNVLGKKTLGIYAIHLAILIPLYSYFPIILNYWVSLLFYTMSLIIISLLFIYLI